MLLGKQPSKTDPECSGDFSIDIWGVFLACSRVEFNLGKTVTDHA